jgi:hypothetical protein
MQDALAPAAAIDSAIQRRELGRTDTPSTEAEPPYWYVRGKDGCDETWDIYGPDSKHLVSIPFWDDVAGTEAKARLIVNSLNMHEQLVKALDYLLEQTVDMDLKYGIGLSEGEADAKRNALETIAKARGEEVIDRQSEATNQGAEEKPEASDLQRLSGNERNKPMAENQNEKNGPLYDLRSGRVQGSIWDREGSNGETRYTWSLSRSYKDKEGNWQRTASFDPEDLPHVKEVLAKAENLLKEELGQSLTSEVKVSRKEEAKQGQKQSF